MLSAIESLLEADAVADSHETCPGIQSLPVSPIVL